MVSTTVKRSSDNTESYEDAERDLALAAGGNEDEVCTLAISGVTGG